ncbi:MAG: SDR family NAD(P)-dependent oxidoreductase [Bdellovibrionota bacterium]
MATGWNEKRVGRPLAVVTGASSGIGRELAKELARRGYDLFLCAGSSSLIRVSSEVTELGAAVVGSINSDLSNSDGVENVAQEIERIGRPVEVLAINAGVGVGGDFATETSLDDELNVIFVNVVSSVHLSKLLLEDMVAQGSGYVLFTGSIAGLMPTPLEAVYGATKAFINSFAESLRNELRDQGVHVTALLPGATETNFFKRAGMEDTPVGRGKKDDPAEVARDGLDALFNEKDKVVAGSLKTRAQAMLSDVLPDKIKAAVHRKQAEPSER